MTDPEAYRGILLADSYAKLFHAWNRKRLLPTLLSRRTEGQLGGFPSQQTTTGIQIVRLHSRLGRLRRLSTGVLFVDLRAAFHHMIREMIFKVRHEWTQTQLLRILDPNEFHLEQLLADIDAACQQQVVDIPEGLRILLHDLHSSTWYQLNHVSDGYTQTTRGTRPGSPMADIGFNLLMARVLAQLQQDLLNTPLYCQGREALNVDIPPVAWVDDLAVPITTASPEHLEPLMGQVLLCVHAVFARHGMTLNFAKGKTEGVMMFRGAGANQCRTKLFDQPKQPSITVSSDSHVLTLRIGASYKHLGVRYAMDADLDGEVTTKIAIAKQAFEAIKKPVLLNHDVPIEARVQLYSSLILSRVLYGCANWADVSTHHLQQLEALITQHHRRMFQEEYWQASHTTDLEFMTKHRLPSFRLLWARHRLVYLQHLAQFGLPFHLQMLHIEFSHGRGWLHEVATDLAWLQSIEPLPFDLPFDGLSWHEFWPILAQCSQWKKLVARAVTKHLMQERIAFEVSSYHDQIWKELRLAGVDMVSKQDDIVGDDYTKQLRCEDCLGTFSSNQKLALHRFRVHGHHSIERLLASSSVCRGCLRDFHTTWRVVQHLRYRRNGCFDRFRWSMSA